MAALSLCMIAKNEEQYLENCLNNIKELADEIIIADTGSTDKTKEIARKFTSKVFDFKWNDNFSEARNFSLSKATKEWILVLDADELIDKAKIRDLLKIKETNVAGFSFEQRSYIQIPFPGCFRNDSSFEPIKKYPFYVKKNLVRLFRNNQGLLFKHRIHEIVEDSIKEKGLKFEKTDIILHHLGSVKDIQKIEDKTKQYSKLILKQLEDNPNSARYNYYAAKHYLSIKDLGNALKYFKKTAEINPEYKLIYSEIAKVYLMMNDVENAMENFRKSMELNPNDPSPANNLAVTLMHKNKLDEAKRILEQQLKKHPNNNALKANYEQLKNHTVKKN